ncbi:MAG: M3 family metallopeptidase, partial [Acholeplasmataceae bacterium]
EMTKHVRTLASYASLRMSTDVTNQEALVYMSKIQQIGRQATAQNVAFTRYLKTVDLEELAKQSTLIHHYLFNLKKEQEEAIHLLSEKEEILYSKLSELGSSSWGQLQSVLTSNVNVNYRDQVITLPEVRNLAYEKDLSVRKDAYDAELKAYEVIEDAVSMALSNIKREVNTMNELRGFESALDKTLIQSNMTKKTLDAMLNAMKAYRVHFASYLKEKARYLGYEGSLPFYDMFAPVGKLEKTYSYEEAQELVKEGFYSYSNRLGDFAKKAFDNHWIDPFPKKGKRGGAFCSNQPQIKQSRILSNFTGSLSDVLTLGHELGHGYHGEVISSNSPLHWSYPMPLAETASIFCETIINNHLLKSITKPEERLSILENSLQGDTQVVIDILSRYFFETSLFEKASGPVSKHQMKEMMVEAQKMRILMALIMKSYIHICG